MALCTLHCSHAWNLGASREQQPVLRDAQDTSVPRDPPTLTVTWQNKMLKEGCQHSKTRSNSVPSSLPWVLLFLPSQVSSPQAPEAALLSQQIPWEC